MGYTTEFSGSIIADPPFSPQEADFISRFSRTRRCKRKNEILEGAFYVCKNPNKEDYGQSCKNIVANNEPPEGQPGLWCQWIINDKNNAIIWNGGEKFYESAEWLLYLFVYFFNPSAIAPTVDPSLRFLKPHKLNGEILCVGEEIDDIWKIVVKNNKITILDGHLESKLLRDDFKTDDQYYDALYEQHNNIINTPGIDADITWKKSNSKLNLPIPKLVIDTCASQVTKEDISKALKTAPNSKDNLKI